MSGAELGLAIFATLDICYGHWKKLVQICKTYRDAESEVKDKFFRIECIWFRIDQQLQYLRRIAPILEEDHLRFQSETVERLASRTKTICGYFAGVLKVTVPDEVDVRKWKYTLRTQEKLNTAIEDLEAWQRLFDPSWFLIMKAAGPGIDLELQDCIDKALHTAPLKSSVVAVGCALASKNEKPPIWLPGNGLDQYDVLRIPNCSAFFGSHRQRGKSIVLESISWPKGNPGTAFGKDIRNLARKLYISSSTDFSLLQCKGISKDSTAGACTTSSAHLVFRVPEGLSNPKSLRGMLEANIEVDSLSDRFRLACELAKSVCYVHTLGFVHKNVRPETILLFDGPEARNGSLFLVGFNTFRATEGMTIRTGDDAWEKNVYRHPSRCGPTPSQDYVMQHDIYSLGVCLLELGLWKSFVTYDKDVGGSPKSIFGMPIQNLQLKDSHVIKDCLTTLASGDLMKVMG